MEARVANRYVEVFQYLRFLPSKLLIEVFGDLAGNSIHLGLGLDRFKPGFHLLQLRIARHGRRAQKRETNPEG